MANIKPLSEIASKWAEVTPGRQTQYESGVRAPVRDWAAAAAAAEGAYEAGVQAALSRKAYGAGVRAAGTAKWQQKSASLGPARWSAGVRAAQSDYQAGFEPYHRVIEGTQLPPRGATGDPRNLDRVAAIANNLHQHKVRSGGG